jgi:hypothetical protein
MQIQIRINESGVLRNQRFAFTNRYTLVTELLQNARRAGATHIEIHHDPAQQRLCVVDNGRGVEDFQKLLTFHESGWGESLVEQEHPFGVGFSKCLYAAKRCVVTSGHQKVDIDTEAALQRASFEVQAADHPVAGTCVELYGVELADLAARMESLCMGFPIPVTFNQRPLEQRFAAHKLQTVDTPVGAVHLCGERDGQSTTQTLVFLQGFCVSQPAWFDARCVNVVHLDSKQFMARLPDRDQLIDADQQLQKMHQQINSCWRTVLNQAKSRLPAERFVSTYFDTMQRFEHLDLLNDLDVLPKQLMSGIVGYPIQTCSMERDFLEIVPQPPTRQAIEAREVKLVCLDMPDENNAAQWMLAWCKNWLVFEAYRLDINHWVHAHVRDLSEEQAQVQAVNIQHRTSMSGRWVWPEVVLCDGVSISVGQDSVEVDDFGVCVEETLYIPARESTGESVRQMSNFVDENDNYIYDHMDADRDELANLIRRLRCTDPADTLASLLQEVELGKYPLLQGHAFEVSIGRPIAGDPEGNGTKYSVAEPLHRVRLLPSATPSGSQRDTPQAGHDATLDDRGNREELTEVMEVRHAEC